MINRLGGIKMKNNPFVDIDKPYIAKNENKVAKVLKTIAILEAILGIIAGYEAADMSYKFVWMNALYFWIPTFISVVFIIAFAEVINLLHKISLK